MDFRFLCLGTRYRKQLAFSPETLADARETHRGLRRRVEALTRRVGEQREHVPPSPGVPGPAEPASVEASQVRMHAARFLDALPDDLNALNALTALHAVVRDETISPARRISLVESFDRVLGLGLTAPLSGSGPNASHIGEKPDEADRFNAEERNLMALRDRARSERNWPESDRLRHLLLARGMGVTDGKDGSRWAGIGGSRS